MNLMYKYVYFIVKYIQDTGEELTGLIVLGWSCDVGRDHV